MNRFAQKQHRSSFRGAAAAALVLCMACGGDGAPGSPTSPSGSAGGSPPGFTVSSFIVGATALDGSRGTLQPGVAPSPSGSGPVATPSANNNIVNGGSNQVRIQSGATFQTVYAFVGGLSGTVQGFWEIRLAVPTRDAQIILTYATALAASNFQTVFAVAGSNGAVGAYSSIPTQVLAASTGEVQVTVSWDAASDVDLHVVDPLGEEIYYGNSSSRSGGQLDLDSNAACGIDGVNNENIRWSSGAPAGTYTVRVDYWSSCGVGQTNYVVTVRNGGTAQTFTGTFTGSGDAGGAGSGRTIATFSRGAGLGSSAAGQRSRPPRLFLPSPEKLGAVLSRGLTKP